MKKLMILITAMAINTFILQANEVHTETAINTATEAVSADTTPAPEADENTSTEANPSLEG